jgi:flavin-dependent dehydrogenase
VQSKDGFQAIPHTGGEKGGRAVSSQQSTDVFVVGGGPAGLAAAIAARQKGLSVILADGAAPPIEKPCGEGMPPETLDALRSLGVQINASEGYKFRGITFAQKGASVSADFPQGTGIGIRRPLLHARLVARAEECGVQLLWKTPVRAIDSEGVQLTHGKIASRWIVGADGQGSRVRRWSNLDDGAHVKKRHAVRRHYHVQPWSDYMEIIWSEHSQIYVTPIGREEICVVVLSENAEHANFADALRELPNLAGKLAGAELASRERGAITVMCTLEKLQRGNVALVGDASGGVDAITGEGLRLAFRQALALADAMAAEDLTLYQQTHAAICRHPMRMGQLMLWLGRHPRIRNRAIRALQDNPNLFARLLATHIGKISPTEILFTSAQLGLALLAI